MIIEYNDDGDHNIILTKSKTRTCEDFGGNLSKKSKKENAIKELQEESALVFNFDPKKLRYYVDLHNKDNKYYRCYVVCINSISKYDIDKIFDNNKNIIMRSSKYKKPDWNETDGIIRIKLKEAIDCIKDHTESKNKYCKVCILRYRTIRCINKIKNWNLNDKIQKVSIRKTKLQSFIFT